MEISCVEQDLFIIGVALDQLGNSQAAIRALQQYDARTHAEIGHERVALYLACITRRKTAPAKDCWTEQLNTTPTK